MTSTFSRRIGRLLVGGAALVLVAGSVLVWPATISAQVEPVPIPAGDVILTDDFSDPGSGWNVSDSQGGRCAYDAGEYVVARVSPDIGTSFCTLREVARDYVAEVDARLPTAGEGDIVAMLARARRLGPGQFRGYIRFTVWPANGRVRMVSIMFGGQGPPDMQVLAEAQDHPAVNRGTATNRLGMKVRDSTFVGYVNGQEVLRVENDAYPDGNIGLEAIGARGSTTEVRFDNLIVSQIGAE